MNNIFSKIAILLFLLFLIFPPVGLAQEGDQGHVVDIYFFYGSGCPHCAKEKVFLQKLEKEISYVNVHDYEVWESQEGRALIKELTQKTNLDTRGVPVTIIGDQVFYGYSSDMITGEEIRHQAEICHINKCEDRVGALIGGEEEDGLEVKSQGEQTELQASPLPESISVPIIGEIKMASVSLPVLTFIIAALDGFNPCAMWVLVFLISLLLGIPNAARRWLLGIVFILASGLVYFLFLTAWLNLFLYLGFLYWVRVVVGILAVAAGIYYLREFWTNREGTCKVTSSPTRRRIMEYLKEVAQGRNLIIALLGIVLIAFAVNLIELICSAGLPAIYTNILSLSQLPSWQYYLYLIEYIFVFMLDDLIVFAIAMVTLQMTGLGNKYSRYSNLIGGIVIAILGILLIFKPGWLMFGG